MPLVLEGLRLMVVGMGMVFLLLLLFVLGMHATTAFLRIFPSLSTDPKAPAIAALPSEELAEVAVAVAAIRAHYDIH